MKIAQDKNQDLEEKLIASQEEILHLREEKNNIKESESSQVNKSINRKIED